MLRNSELGVVPIIIGIGGSASPDEVRILDMTRTLGRAHLIRRLFILESARVMLRYSELGWGCLGGSASLDEVRILDMT